MEETISRSFGLSCPSRQSHAHRQLSRPQGCGCRWGLLAQRLFSRRTLGGENARPRQIDWDGGISNPSRRTPRTHPSSSHSTWVSPSFPPPIYSTSSFRSLFSRTCTFSFSAGRPTTVMVPMGYRPSSSPRTHPRLPGLFPFFW